MPLPVIPNVCRVTLNWTNPGGGVRAVNVTHWQTGGDGFNVSDFGTQFDANIANDLWKPIHSDYQLLTIDMLPLDGTSPTSTKTLTPGATGGSAGDVIPAMCQINSLRTDQRGPEGRGRLFLGPTGDSWWTNGLSGSTELATLEASWVSFLLAMHTAGDLYALMVASYAHATANFVQTMHFPQSAGIQRRRQEQLS